MTDIRPTVDLLPWQVLADESRYKEMKAALEAARGNITAAAEVLGISYAQASRYLNRFELRALATELRVAAGARKTQYGGRQGTATGRPRSKVR
jgi:molybdenum-dependent DNA-binding transcriptional regulator ModE